MPTVLHRVRHVTRKLGRHAAVAVGRSAALARRPASRSAVAFIGSRAFSAALMLAQLGVVAALFDTAAAATFFVLWTLVWASSVWLRFGVDQVIPRKAAHARITGDLAGLAGARGVTARTAPVLAVALPLLVALTVGSAPAERTLLVAGLCFAAAAAWGAIVLLAALLRGFAAVGRSGAVQGVLPSAALLAASIIAPQISDGWIGLLAASTVALWVALVAAVAVTARAIGRPAIGSMLFARGPADAEQLPAGLLTVLSEVGLALPLLLGSAVGLADAELSALYAAGRVAGVFSWTAGAVAAVATPRLAMAIARRAAVAPLLRRSTIAAAATSLPLAAVGILLPSQLLGAMSHEFAPYGALLVILVAGRLVDACTGPLSEALIVGGRVRLELANLCVFVATVTAACLVLEPAYGVEGLAAAIALGTVACSLPRVVQVRRALRTTWRSDETVAAIQTGRPAAVGPPAAAAGEPHRSAAPVVDCRTVVTLAVVALCALLHGTVAGGLLDYGSQPGLLLLVVATTLVTLAVATVEARRRSGGVWTAVVVSPLAGALLAWTALFAWRPLSLWLWPSDTTLALTAIGYTPQDLTRAAAIGGLGCALWTLGYLALMGRARSADLPMAPAADRLTRAAMWKGIALIGFGSALVALLFAREGGFAVLTSAPGQLHNGGSGSGYAVLGAWIVQGVALRGLVGVLSGDGPRARWLLALGTVVAVLLSVAMQARGLLFLGVVAAGVIVLCLRTPSRRAVALTALLAVVALPASVFAQQIRSYSQRSSPEEAVELALKTPPGTFMISDLSVFDNLVALDKLVPESVDRLGGSTVAAVPSAFVPRAVWPEKPLPLDQQVTEVLYPGVPAGGSPVGMQGELLWNFGLAGVALGGLVIGALMGLLARARRRIRGAGAYALYGVAIASVVAPLTRAFAPMATNTAMALLGVLLVAAALGPLPRRAWTAALARARALADAAPVIPSSGGRHVRAVDGLRALAALLVVFAHVGGFAVAPDRAPFGDLASALAHFAVTIFFTVSAFVLYRPFIAARAAGAPEPALGRFLIRRLVRILPAYWLLLTILALFGGAPGALSQDWWRYYFLLQIYTPDPLLAQGGIGPAWTLAVEVTFYLLLVGVAVLMRRRWLAASTPAARWRGELLMPCAFFALGAIPWILALDDPGLYHVRTTLAGTVGWFAAGMACAVLSVRAEHGIRPAWPVRALRDHPALCWAVGAATIAWLATIPRFPAPGGPLVTLTPLDGTVIVLAGVLAAMLCCAPILLGGGPSGRIVRMLSSRPVVWLGITCYGTYLIHHGLITLLIVPWHGIDDPMLKTFVGFAIIYPLAVAVGAASWYLVERPLIRAVGRALRKRMRRAEIGPGAPVRSPA